jgi:hypothetical protein
MNPLKIFVLLNEMRKDVPAECTLAGEFVIDPSQELPTPTNPPTKEDVEMKRDLAKAAGMIYKKIPNEMALELRGHPSLKTPADKANGKKLWDALIDQEITNSPLRRIMTEKLHFLLEHAIQGDWEVKEFYTHLRTIQADLQTMGETITDPTLLRHLKRGLNPMRFPPTLVASHMTGKNNITTSEMVNYLAQFEANTVMS